MTINNKSERNYQGKCLGWPVTSYGGGFDRRVAFSFKITDILSFPLSLQTYCMGLTKLFKRLFYLVVFLICYDRELFSVCLHHPRRTMRKNVI